ncbi:hypothetical protein GCM10023238_30040 [Streptomyces heliomycini]
MRDTAGRERGRWRHHARHHRTGRGRAQACNDTTAPHDEDLPAVAVIRHGGAGFPTPIASTPFWETRGGGSPYGPVTDEEFLAAGGDRATWTTPTLSDGRRSSRASTLRTPLLRLQPRDGPPSSTRS